MKKLTLLLAAAMISVSAFAHEGKGCCKKEGEKTEAKSCCKKDASAKSCCKKDGEKSAKCDDAKSTSAKTSSNTTSAKAK